VDIVHGGNLGCTEEQSVLQYRLPGSVVRINAIVGWQRPLKGLAVKLGENSQLDKARCENMAAGIAFSPGSLRHFFGQHFVKVRCSECMDGEADNLQHRAPGS